MTSSFASLVDAFLQEQYVESPVLASSLGLTAYDERLDDLSGSLPTALAERAIAKDEARGGRALRGGAPSFS